MTATPWPTSGVPDPEVYRISPRYVAVNDASPFTGSKSVMLRYQQWHVYLQWNNTTGNDYWGVFGHFAASDGGRVIFQIPIFGYRAKRGTKSGTVNLSGAHSAGATSLTITGGTGTFLRGDWVQFNQVSGVPRAHVITSSESGGVILIRPGLRADAQWLAGTPLRRRRISLRHDGATRDQTSQPRCLRL